MVPWVNTSHLRKDIVWKEEAEESCVSCMFFLLYNIGSRRARRSVPSQLGQSHFLTCAANLIKSLIAEVFK